MLSELELQHAVADAILNRRGPDLGPSFDTGGRFDPMRRFNIYRNNTFASLSATLVSVFPVAVSLIGERYFRHIAASFIRVSPPSEARLVRYGSDFADFLGRLEDLKPMPFIADTARLEWLIAEALDAPALQPANMAELSRGGEGTMPDLILQPSLRLLFCRWPALDIWSAHQASGDLEQLGGIRRQPQRIALWRNRDSVRFLRLNGAHYAFLQALKSGRGLEHAVKKAAARDPNFDLVASLGGLFADGLVTRVRHQPANIN
ncbi:putative DNA-binding domain-containing protein [Rhizobium leguminosarum]|uniref:HvfC/BufC family peptide modification chaperone n=1 Tax=Rhizobium leguminosarum TaxID=384 RepID=UPI0014422D79|nr:putative DNA-binding domain-containing protein [Rhizobium leguminosarum]MBY5836796.1 DUF2063 domain-containing protein [Rhizobium leguminosarum]NKM81132.1 DUF2063 domain-containing protein [Rhizobium leguminosarum bv. viciae]QSZ09306.1 putative DNA-binding domain-containing protein [Rhizobium leguminosarum]